MVGFFFDCHLCAKCQCLVVDILFTSSQIVGPMLYGFTYSAIVGTYPQGIFFVSFGATSLALAALFFVELPKGPSDVAGGARLA